MTDNSDLIWVNRGQPIRELLVHFFTRRKSFPWQTEQFNAQDSAKFYRELKLHLKLPEPDEDWNERIVYAISELADNFANYMRCWDDQPWYVAPNEDDTYDINYCLYDDVSRITLTVREELFPLVTKFLGQ